MLNKGIETDYIGNMFGISSFLLAPTGFDQLIKQGGPITTQPWGNNEPKAKPLKKIQKNIHLLMTHLYWSNEGTKTDKYGNIYAWAWPQ